MSRLLWRFLNQFSWWIRSHMRNGFSPWIRALHCSKSIFDVRNITCLNGTPTEARTTKPGTTKPGATKPGATRTGKMRRSREILHMLLQNFFTFSWIFSLCCTLIFNLFHRQQELNYMERNVIKSRVRAWVIVLRLGQTHG
jgi:hypothetical protein